MTTHGGYGHGKMFASIKESAKRGAPILVRTPEDAETLKKIAVGLGISIPEPLVTKTEPIVAWSEAPVVPATRSCRQCFQDYAPPVSDDGFCGDACMNEYDAQLMANDERETDEVSEPNTRTPPENE